MNQRTSTPRLSLDDVKRIRRESQEKLTFDEILQLQMGKRSRATEQEDLSDYAAETSSNSDEVYKSLDEVIEERQIQKPRKYGPTSSSEPRPSTSAAARAPEPVEIKLRTDVDPMSHSLDAMIERTPKGKRGKNTGQTDGSPKPKRRLTASTLEKLKVVKADFEIPKEYRDKIKHIMTPYRALSLLSAKGMLFELCIGSLKDNVDKERRWRCEVYSGEVKGICESERKVLAREMACHQFLQRVREAFSSETIPSYDIPEELFIDPRVMKNVAEECKKGRMPIAHETRVIDSKLTELYGRVYPLYTFQCTYSVGGEEFIGISSDETYAQLQAAKKAFEYVTNSRLPPTKYFLEKACDSRLKYDFNETMACQIIGNDESEYW